MSSNATNSYDDVPYEAAAPLPQTHPDHLATIGRMFGMRPPPVDRCRVLELGCADGSNLIPMALELPDSTLLGIDLSEREVAAGRQLVERLELSNVELRHGNILELGPELGEVDYLLCHGVFSWVPPFVQDKILDLCARQLSPNGIAYISYNTYPGWHQRGMVREMMRYHTQGFPVPRERIEQGRALVRFLAEAVPAESGPHGAYLHQQLDEMRNWDDSFLFHDSLEECNQPLYFHEFMARADAQGLRYLGESEFHAMVGSNLPAAVFQTLSKLSNDLVRMEQYMDFVRNRSFRQTLLCRKNVPLQRGISPTRLQEMQVSSRLKTAATGKELTTAEPVRFQLGQSGSMRIEHPFVKAALRRLQEIWPERLSFDELVVQTQSRMLPQPAVQNTAANTAANDADQRAYLADMLLLCFSRGLIELHQLPVHCVWIASDHPTASPLARWQAGQGISVTNQCHKLVRLDATHCQLLRLLDGTRDHAALHDQMLRLALDGTLQLEQAGRRLTDRQELSRLLSDTIGLCLQNLARAALLLN